MADPIHFYWNGDLMHAQVEYINNVDAYRAFDFHNSSNSNQTYQLIEVTVTRTHAGSASSWTGLDGDARDIYEALGEGIEQCIINVDKPLGEGAIIIKIGDEPYLIFEHLIQGGMLFRTSVNGRAISFRINEHGDLKPSYYPTDLDPYYLDAIAEAIEKYHL